MGAIGQADPDRPAHRDPSKQGARLLVSGILPEDRPEIAGAFSAVGGSVAGSKERDGWLAMEIQTRIVHDGSSRNRADAL